MVAKEITMAAKKPISTHRRRGRPSNGERPMSSTERAAATRARQRAATDAYWAAKEGVTPSWVTLPAWAMDLSDLKFWSAIAGMIAMAVSAVVALAGYDQGC